MATTETVVAGYERADLLGLLLAVRRAIAPPAPPPHHQVEAVAAELAACLERFLSATADEPTVRRAREALVTWATLR